MKITIYELLGLIKDGKAPKKIKIHKTIYEWVFIHHEFCYADNSINRILLFEYYVRNNKLNDEIEIIEEDKKIEFEEIEELTCGTYDFEKQTINSLIKNQRKLINEVNKLKEGK